MYNNEIRKRLFVNKGWGNYKYFAVYQTFRNKGVMESIRKICTWKKNPRTFNKVVIHDNIFNLKYTRTKIVALTLRMIFCLQLLCCKMKQLSGYRTWQLLVVVHKLNYLLKDNFLKSVFSCTVESTMLVFLYALGFWWLSVIEKENIVQLHHGYITQHPRQPKQV